MRYIEIRLTESAQPTDIASDKETWVAGLSHLLDESSAATILEAEELDRNELASLWFDSCLRIYAHLAAHGKAPVYRHMRVENFKDFVRSLRDGTGRVGEYWSIDHSISSPTWDQDHRGNVDVMLSGFVPLDQIDWEGTLHQNFEYPQEYELVFRGPVMVSTVLDDDAGTTIKINKVCQR